MQISILNKPLHAPKRFQKLPSFGRPLLRESFTDVYVAANSGNWTLGAFYQVRRVRSALGEVRISTGKGKTLREKLPFLARSPSSLIK